MTAHPEPASRLPGIAEEAYVYLSPLVLMDLTRRVSINVPPGARPGFGPMNTFSHMRAFPPGDFKEVIRPNFDTLYSIVWYDVRSEPLVISVPETGGRYYMLPMLDMWTDVFAVVGSRTTGTGAGAYAVVGPGWSGTLPAGVSRIDAPTPIGWIIGRTQTNGPSDYPAVHSIQDGFVATPLSAWPGEPPAAVFTPDPGVDMATPPLTQVQAMSGPDFFAYATGLLRQHPPHPVDQPMLARMAQLGLAAGEVFDVAASAPDVRAAIEAAPAAAQLRMAVATPRLTPLVNGWASATSGMGVYGADYLRRAVISMIGLGANLVADAVYPMLVHDVEGEMPDGANDYVLHFSADALPPAGAFWSVTMYDGVGYPVPNAIERYAIGDRDPLGYNADGSLDLFVQHEDPGEERRSNWLPAPRGPLGITMRLYDPGRLCSTGVGLRRRSCGPDRAPLAGLAMVGDGRGPETKTIADTAPDIAADVASFFAAAPLGMSAYRAVLAAAADLGPVEVRVTRSQVAFRRRVGFAWLWLPGRYLDRPAAEVVLSIGLRERIGSPRWKEIVEVRPGRWMHHLELHAVSEVDAEVRGWLWRAWEAAA